MNRLSNKEILRVHTNIEGTPVSIINEIRAERVIRIYDKWHSHEGNDDKAERCYFKIRTNKGLICDIYREEMTKDWHIEKKYE